jgi:hypothetical protein
MKDCKNNSFLVIFPAYPRSYSLYLPGSIWVSGVKIACKTMNEYLPEVEPKGIFGYAMCV